MSYCWFPILHRIDDTVQPSSTPSASHAFANGDFVWSWKKFVVFAASQAQIRDATELKYCMSARVPSQACAHGICHTKVAPSPAEATCLECSSKTFLANNGKCSYRLTCKGEARVVVLVALAPLWWVVVAASVQYAAERRTKQLVFCLEYCFLVIPANGRLSHLIFAARRILRAWHSVFTGIANCDVDQPGRILNKSE